MDDLPKGMHTAPEEFAGETEGKSSLTHDETNYTKLIRQALYSLVDDGIDITIKNMEIAEKDDSPTMIAIVLEVRSTK